MIRTATYWLCVDCTLYAVNGDTSGIGDDKRERATIEGVNALGADLVADYHIQDDETDAPTSGHYDFARLGCDACGSRLAGEYHRFATLGDELAPKAPRVTCNCNAGIHKHAPTCPIVSES